MSGKLYLVATPIGNLDDLSHRAVAVLKEVSFIVCEDTRRTRALLSHLGISNELWSLPAFAEGERSGKILDRVEAGASAALVTDAGSPAISDPGEKLVSEAVARRIDVVPIPGPAALIAALGASGLPTGRFHFLGFLPRQGPERQAMLEEVAALSATLVLYESPRRLVDLLAELLNVLGDRPACVARELTKRHEEFLRGPLSELKAHFESKEALGEVVVLVEGRIGESRWTEENVQRALEEGLESGEKLKPLSTDIARKAGWSGQDVYRLGLSLKKRG